MNHFANDGSTALIATLFPVLISDLSISAFYIGVLVATGYLVTMVFQPVAGHLTKNHDSRYLLAIGISFVGLSMIFFLVSVDFVMFLIAMVILRFGSSFFHPVGVSLISNVYDGELLDRYMGIQSSFGNLGIFVVFAVSAPLYLYFGWKAPFLAFLLLDVTAVTLTLALVREGRPVSIPDEKEIKPPSVKYRLGLPIFFIALMPLVGGTYAIFVNYGNILLAQHSFGLVLSDDLISAWLATAFLGAIFTGYLTRKFGRFRLILLSFLVSGISALFFVAFSGVIVIAGATLAINGFFSATIYPALYSELASFLGKDTGKRGTSFGILFSGQILGSAIFGFLGGYIGSYAGFTVLFVIAAIILLSGVPLTMQWHIGMRKISQHLN